MSIVTIYKGNTINKSMDLMFYMPSVIALLISLILSYYVYKKLAYNKYVNILVFLVLAYVLWIILSFVVVSLIFAIGVFKY